MHLSRFTDYSLRTLFLVAANPDRLVTLSEIASFYEISIDHLRKVVHLLGRLGYLETHRGAKGGMRLARLPELINIGRLISETEGNEPLVSCGSECRLTPVCDLKGVLHEAQQAFFSSLGQYSLADLMKNADMHALLTGINVSR